MEVVPAVSPRRPLKLLQVLGHATDGARGAGITGVERVVQQLLDGLDSTRFEHSVVYPAGGLLRDAYQRRARAVASVEPRQRYDRIYVDALAQFAQQQGVDVVMSHGLRFDFLAQLACRQLHLPHVVVRAVALADERMSPARKLAFGIVDAWTLRHCTGIIAVSRASKRRMLRTQLLSADRITVIPNGVRLPTVSAAARGAARHALGLDGKTLLVGGVGQLIRRKSFATLVEALALLAPEHPALTAVLLGEGPERARLEQLARQHNVRLLLPGFRPDPYDIVAAFDIAVLPSLAEGMPLVVLESMGLGVATVATPAAGTAELIEDGVSGLLVPRGDPRALARALARLLRDADLRRKLGAAAAARVQTHYGLDAMLQSFDAYLWRIAGRSAA